MYKKIARFVFAFCCIVLFLLSTEIFVFASSINENSEAYEYADDEYQREIDVVNKQIEAYINGLVIPMSGYSKYLSVPLYRQGNNFYCGPASVQITLKYVTGTLYTQSVLAGSMGTASNGGTYVYKIRDELNKRIGNSAYQYVNTSDAVFGNDIIYSINAGKPIICHVLTGVLPNYNGASNTGHYIVVTGYYAGSSGNSSTATCRYDDPHYSNTYYGTYTCNISTMIKAINNNAGYYIRGV